MGCFENLNWLKKFKNYFLFVLAMMLVGLTIGMFFGMVTIPTIADVAYDPDDPTQISQMEKGFVMDHIHDGSGHLGVCAGLGAAAGLTVGSIGGTWYALSSSFKGSIVDPMMKKKWFWPLMIGVFWSMAFISAAGVGVYAYLSHDAIEHVEASVLCAGIGMILLWVSIYQAGKWYMKRNMLEHSKQHDQYSPIPPAHGFEQFEGHTDTGARQFDPVEGQKGTDEAQPLEGLMQTAGPASLTDEESGGGSRDRASKGRRRLTSPCTTLGMHSALKSELAYGRRSLFRLLKAELALASGP